MAIVKKLSMKNDIVVKLIALNYNTRELSSLFLAQGSGNEKPGLRLRSTIGAERTLLSIYLDIK